MWKIFRVVLAVAMLFALLMVAGSVRTFRWVHGLVRYYVGDITGADPIVSWLFALAVFALVCLIPWRSLLFAPLRARPKPLIILAVACFAGAVTLNRINARLPSDQQGKPKSNNYFDFKTGTPKAWFLPGTCETRDRDGYDDLGRKLEPATSEKVESCGKLRSEADRRLKQQAEAQQRRERREQQNARKQRFQEIGRYLAVGRWVEIDGLKFVLEEVVVMRHETYIKFRVVNVRDEQTPTSNSSGFDFGLVNSEGSRTRSSAIRRVQGAVSVADSSLVTPRPGDHGWIAVEFARDSDSGPFGVLINSAVAFTNPAGHIVRFTPF